MSTTAPSQLLRDIVELEKGKPPVKTPYIGQGTERYLTPDFLRNRDNTEPNHVLPGPNAVRVLDGQTIILWDGSNAGEVLKARDGMLASTMMKVHPNSAFDSGYFYYALKFWEDYLKSQTAGSGIPHVDKEIVGALSILKCKKIEQTKIAEILSTVDKAIEQTELLIAKQQRIKFGLIQDLLTRGIDENGKLRSENTHEFKDSPLGRVPVEWEVKQLTDFANVYGGKRLPPGHNYAKENSGFRYLRVLDFYDREINYFDLVLLDERTFKALERYEIFASDLCVSIAGSLGYFSVVVPPQQMRIVLTENAARICPSENVNPNFLCAALNSSAVQAQIKIKIGIGGGVPKLALFRIKSLFVPIPKSRLEQNNIFDVLRAHRRSTLSYLNTQVKLRSLKSALMQDLLTGKVRVTQLLTKAEVEYEE